jgi:hypothetical protein
MFLLLVYTSCLANAHQVKREWCEKRVLIANATAADATHKPWCEVRSKELSTTVHYDD